MMARMNNTNVLEIPSIIPGIADYRILFEKEESSLEKQRLPHADQKLFEELYVRVQEDPQKHIESLIHLYHLQPQVPEIANLLAYAYLRLKKKREAEALIEKTYHEHPDYLIARINYADQCLRLGHFELVPAIFNNIFELNALYPDRDNFHYAEFRGFQIVMGFYHLEISEREKAEEYYQLAFQVDPLHPSVAALELRLLKKSLLKKCLHTLQKLARISKKP